MKNTRFGIYRPPNPEYTLGHRLLELFGIGAFFTLTSLLAVWCWTQEHGAGNASLVLAAFVGYIGSDFISGFVHWAGDTLGDEETPILGKAFIRPFREHHTDQKEITRHDFVETNGNNCLITLLPMLAVYWSLPERRMPVVAFFVASFVSVNVATFGTNQFHKWAHMDVPPPFVSLLQKLRIILNPGHHSIHHTAPYEKHYCITVGWLNPLLTGTKFWRGMEWSVRTIFGSLVKVASHVPAVLEEAATGGSRPLPTE